jgi:hypothetical protein
MVSNPTDRRSLAGHPEVVGENGGTSAKITVERERMQ